MTISDQLHRLATTVSSNIFYHGTPHQYTKPKLSNGILWLATSPKVALHYSQPHYHKGKDTYLWTIQLRSGAKIVDLKDISNPTIAELRDALNTSFFRATGPVSDQDWPSMADFGILEIGWVPKFLKSKRIDAVKVQDSLDTTGIPHDSIALLNLRTISDMSVEVVPSNTMDRSKTIGEISEDLKS